MTPLDPTYDAAAARLRKVQRERGAYLKKLRRAAGRSLVDVATALGHETVTAVMQAEHGFVSLSDVELSLFAFEVGVPFDDVQRGLAACEADIR